MPINAISIVSVCGVAITTLALICTLSVYNGFTQLIGSLYSQIDPQIKITPREGKTLDTEAPEIKQIASWPEVSVFSPVVEDNALCLYKDRQRAVLVKGVPDNYTQLSHIQELVTSGHFQLNDGRIDYVSLGIGVAGQLGISNNSPYPVELYTPNRLGRVNLANPAQSFSSRRFFVASTFCSNQAIYDDQLVILPLATAREMFSYTTEATAIELRLAPRIQRKPGGPEVENALGDTYPRGYPHRAERLVQMGTDREVDYLPHTLVYPHDCHLQRDRSPLDAHHRQETRHRHPAKLGGRRPPHLAHLPGRRVAHLGHRCRFGTYPGRDTLLPATGVRTTETGQHRGHVHHDAYPVRLELFDTLAVTAIVLVLGFVTAWYPAKFLRKRLLAEKSNRE